MKVGFRPFTEADALTIRQNMPFTFSEGTNGIVAFNKETHATLAVLVATDWTFTTCQVHQVILNPMVIRHGWFHEIGRWMFELANRTAIYAPTRSDNEKIVNFNKKLGFREVVRLKDGYDRGVDIVLMEMKPEDVNPSLWQPTKWAEAANG